MNEVRRPDRDAVEIARIRDVVARHPLPDFVTGFDVRLGEVEGEPAMWIVFRTVDDAEQLSQDELMARVARWRALRDAVQADLLAEVETWFPHFRLEPAETLAAH